MVCGLSCRANLQVEFYLQQAPPEFRQKLVRPGMLHLLPEHIQSLLTPADPAAALRTQQMVETAEDRLATASEDSCNDTPQPISAYQSAASSLPSHRLSSAALTARRASAASDSSDSSLMSASSTSSPAQQAPHRRLQHSAALMASPLNARVRSNCAVGHPDSTTLSWDEVVMARIWRDRVLGAVKAFTSPVDSTAVVSVAAVSSAIALLQLAASTQIRTDCAAAARRFAFAAPLALALSSWGFLAFKRSVEDSNSSSTQRGAVLRPAKRARAVQVLLQLLQKGRRSNAVMCGGTLALLVALALYLARRRR